MVLNAPKKLTFRVPLVVLSWFWRNWPPSLSFASK